MKNSVSLFSQERRLETSVMSEPVTEVLTMQNFFLKAATTVDEKLMFSSSLYAGKITKSHKVVVWCCFRLKKKWYWLRIFGMQNLYYFQ